MKSELIAGDALDFGTTVPDYPASDGWTLTYRLVPQTSGTPYTFNATASDDQQSYVIEVSSTTTVGWAAGVYSWVAYVTKDGERHVVDQGPLTIKPDPVTSATLDVRTDAAKMLDQVRAAKLAYTASQGMVQEYEIAGRRMKFRSIEEIVTLETNLQKQVVEEEKAARLAAGMGYGGKVYTRFTT